jgi:hypothetical protein
MCTAAAAADCSTAPYEAATVPAVRDRAAASSNGTVADRREM